MADIFQSIAKPAKLEKGIQKATAFIMNTLLLGCIYCYFTIFVE